MSQELVLGLLKKLGGRARTSQIRELARVDHPDSTLKDYVLDRLRRLERWGRIRKETADLDPLWILVEPSSRSRPIRVPSAQPVQIVNVVATGRFNREFALETLAARLAKVEYEPEQYGSLIYRPWGKKPALLLTKRGKVIIVGASSVAQTTQLLGEFVATARAIGWAVDPCALTIANLVGVFSLDREVELHRVASKIPNVEYEPEQFPGAILRLPDHAATALLFASGKVVVAGAKSEAGLRLAVDQVGRLLAAYL